jgi:hypothetical protein
MCDDVQELAAAAPAVPAAAPAVPAAAPAVPAAVPVPAVPAAAFAAPVPAAAAAPAPASALPANVPTVAAAQPGVATAYELAVKAAFHQDVLAAGSSSEDEEDDDDAVVSAEHAAELEKFAREGYPLKVGDIIVYFHEVRCKRVNVVVVHRLSQYNTLCIYFYAGGQIGVYGNVNCKWGASVWRGQAPGSYYGCTKVPHARQKARKLFGGGQWRVRMYVLYVSACLHMPACMHVCTCLHACLLAYAFA